MLRQALLRRVLTVVGGGIFPPSPAAVARLDGWDGRRRSLAGCLLERRGPHLVVVREPARIDNEGVAWMGEGALDWDHRWRLAAERPIATVLVRGLGRHAAALRPARVPAVVAAGLPALWRGRGTARLSATGLGGGTRPRACHRQATGGNPGGPGRVHAFEYCFKSRRAYLSSQAYGAVLVFALGVRKGDPLGGRVLVVSWPMRVTG